MNRFAEVPLLAWFNNPALLGWLAAAAAPLVIHLLSRRRYHEAPWAAMQFLLAAIRKNARRLLVEQWLLLALRTLALILIVLAVAEPVWEQAALHLGSGERVHKLLVLDGSYSMAYKPTDQSLFERARELAGRIVEESNLGDGFTLVLLADPPRVVVGTPAFEPSDFLEELAHLKLPHGGADLPATLGLVEEVLARARREHPGLKRAEVIFLTDLGRTCWLADLAASAAHEFRERSRRLGEQASLVIVDLGQDQAENVAITDLWLEQPYATARRQITVLGEVRNFGRQPQHRRLEWLVDGRRVGEETLQLEPGGRTTISLSYRFETAGNRAIEARLAPDLLDVDDRRWLSIPVKDQLRVLLVSGRPASANQPGAADYLDVALAPLSAEQGALVRTRLISERMLAEVPLEEFDCVVLADVAQFTAGEARLLASYVHAGGGLIFFLGPQVQTENYNRHLYTPEDPRLRLLPARLGPLVDQPEYVYFNPLGYSHPLLAAFRGQERAGLLSTPVRAYVKLELAATPPHTAAKLALAFNTGDAAVVEEPLGRGRVILVATSADASWNFLPTSPAFVPLVQEMLGLAVRGQVAERNVLVGQPLADTLPAAAAQSSIRLRLPQGEAQVVRVTSEPDGAVWSWADTFQSGLYTAEPPLAGLRAVTFAVNVDTAESDLERLDPAELAERVWAGVRFEHLTDWQDPLDRGSIPVVRRGSFHQQLLGMALCVLLTELLLATWMGRRMA